VCPAYCFPIAKNCGCHPSSSWSNRRKHNLRCISLRREPATIFPASPATGTATAGSIWLSRISPGTDRSRHVMRRSSGKMPADRESCVRLPCGEFFVALTGSVRYPKRHNPDRFAIRRTGNSFRHFYCDNVTSNYSKARFTALGVLAAILFGCCLATVSASQTARGNVPYYRQR
jgi:hypothetical protein